MGTQAIDRMHDDVTRPKGSMVVVVTLKSKMAASCASRSTLISIRQTDVDRLMIRTQSKG